MAKSKTSFTKETQPKSRRPRGQSERTKILEAMKRAGQTEESFYDLLVERATNEDDNFAFKELLARLSPIPKSVSPLVEFDFPKEAKPHIQSAYVLEAVSNGTIPSDIGAMFIHSIKTNLDVSERIELKERTEKSNNEFDTIFNFTPVGSSD